MIYLFIYLTASTVQAASAASNSRLRLLGGFLHDYTEMYQTALQRAQEYLKPREHTIDYHYSPAKVCCIPLVL